MIQKSRLLLGGILFSIVSVAAYSIWAFAGRLFPNESSLYAAITICYLAMGGGAVYLASARNASLLRTWTSIAAGFICFGILWSALYFWIGGTHGETFGNALGLLAFVAVVKVIHRSPNGIFTPLSVAFFASTLGYYLGELGEFWLKGMPTVLPSLSDSYATAGKLVWGFFHGFGLGVALTFTIDWFTGEPVESESI